MPTLPLHHPDPLAATLATMHYPNAAERGQRQTLIDYLMPIVESCRQSSQPIAYDLLMGRVTSVAGMDLTDLDERVGDHRIDVGGVGWLHPQHEGGRYHKHESGCSHEEDFAFAKLRRYASAADLRQHLVEMPAAGRREFAFSETGRHQRPELVDPAAHSFPAGFYPALREQLFDIADAEREPETEPDRQPDHRRRKPVPLE